MSPTSDYDWLIRAYDAKTGALLWQNEFDGAEGNDGVIELAVRRRAVIVAGYSTNAVSPTSSTDWLVRAYDIKTGDLLWEDLFDMAGDSQQASTLAVKGRAVFVAGTVSNAVSPTSHLDLLVGALAAR